MQLLAVPALIYVSLTSLILLVTEDWRWSLSILALQYVGVTLLAAQAWPLAIASTILISGWMSAAVIGMAIVSDTSLRSSLIDSQEMGFSFEDHSKGINFSRLRLLRFRLPQDRLFHLLAAFLVLLTAATLAPQLTDRFPEIGAEPAWGGFILIGMGMLQLGFTARPLPTILGLLTIISGFEVLYAEVETSLLVAGLIAAISLGLAFVCAYLLLAPTMEETE